MNPGKAMAIRILVHSLLFILAGAAAGYASAVFQPPSHAAPSAMMGAAIALGAVMLNPWRASRPRNRGHVHAQGTATLIAILAANAIGYGLFAGEARSWNDWTSGSIERLSSCVAPAYALTMLMGYRARIADAPLAWLWFAAAALLDVTTFSARLSEPAIMPCPLFFGAMPFVGLWLLSTWLADRAWTEECWLRRCGRHPLLHTSPQGGDAAAAT